MVAQILYAVWLTPEDFGLWATASASVFLISAITNFGEVNGYLASVSPGLAGVTVRTRKANFILSLVALAIAMGYWVASNSPVAFLVVILAVELPFHGRANLLYAASLKLGRRRQIVTSQLLASLGRVAVGAALAWGTSSPGAIAVSMLVYSVSLSFFLRLALRRHEGYVLADRGSAPANFRVRVDRAAHQLTQLLPTQIDYLVVAAVATPALLGTYFFAYQATVSVTSLLVGPLSKTAMASLSGVPIAERARTIYNVLLYLVGGAAVLVALLMGGVYIVSPIVPGAWMDTIPVLVILLCSIPARFVSPLAESLQMTNGRWRRSSLVNVLDGIGTAVAALSALTGDVVLLALAVTAWKAGFACVRAVIGLNTLGMRRLGHVLLSPVLCVGFAFTGALVRGVPQWGVVVAVAVVGALQLMTARWVVLSDTVAEQV